MDKRQTVEKLEKRIQEINSRRLTPVQEIHTFRTWRDERTNEINDIPPNDISVEMNAPEMWGSEDGYLWLECCVQLPEMRENEKIAGCFDFNSIHEGYASGFEAMLYVNGQPWQGVDENHKIVILDRFAGTEVTLLFKLWAGITGGPKYTIYHQIQSGQIGYLHSDIERFALLSEVTLQQAKELAQRDAGRTILLDILEESFRKLDWVSQDESLFRESVKEASNCLMKRLAEYPDREQFTVHCIGHTHIDLAWMWRVKHTKEKALRSFSTVLRLFEEFPDFRFYHSTPQLYEYIKEQNPQLYSEIKSYIQEGRWEAGGGMWVEADCNLPGGESLVRQILYGKQFFKEEFGVDTTYLWLPDAFGFPFCLPQLMKKSGMTTFFTSKLSWNKQNRFPHDTFLWRGLDGSEVMAYFLTTPAYGFPTQEWAVTYNGDVHPKALNGAYEIYQEKAWNRDVALTYGHGDGGGGCTREMVQKVKAVSMVPFGPKVVYSQPEQFFDTVRKNIQGKEPLPVWEGELYLEYHRGTYTSQAFAKRANRKLEIRLRNLEYFLLCDAAQKNAGYENVENLKVLWKVLLKNQFHDILPGSSIHEVYEDAKADYEWLNEKLDAVETRLFGADRKEAAVTVWNLGNWEMDMQVEVPACEDGFIWTKEDGTIPECAETVKGTYLLQMKKLTPMAGCILWKKAHQKKNDLQEPMLSSIDLDANTVESDRYLIKWKADGSLERLYDKILNFEVFLHKPGNRLTVYEDKPLLFDAWDIDSYYTEKTYFPNLIGVEVEENTQLRTILKFRYEFGKSELHQQMILRKEQAMIEFATEAWWQERQCLLKASFPVNVLAREAVFDTQFGNLVRSTTTNTDVEEAKFEVCAHRFVDVSQRDRGAAILNDCKYGHDVKGSTIGLTLIKSAVDPDDRADQGYHEFRYAICPHAGRWYENRIQEQAFAFNNPAVVLPGVAGKADPLIELEGDYVELDTVKRAEDGNGMIVRFHEYAGGDSRVVLGSRYPIYGFQACDLLENAVDERINVDRLEVIIKPYEILTYRVFL